MKRQLLAGVAMAALVACGAARAADMPLKAPPLAAPAWTWSGFYIGGHGGYGWGHDSFGNLNDHDGFFDIFFSGKFPTFLTTGFDSKGLLGGFQAGENWQSGNFVGGLEIDLSETDIKGSKSTSPAPTVGGFGVNTATWTQGDNFSLLGTARARLGYLVQPNVLLYGTGGLAWTRVDQDTALTVVSIGPPPPPTNNTVSASSSIPIWRFGWAAGLGAEARILDTNWLLRLEYLHYDFGDAGYSFSSGAGAPNVSSGDLTVDVVRAGLSSKFNPPVIAYAAAPAPMLYKAPARVAASWSWAGFYLGAHGGYGWGQDPFDNRLLVNNVSLSGVDSHGFVGGFQAGGNWQSGSVVGGLEIDLSGTGIKGSASGGLTTVGGGTTTVAQGTEADKFDLLGSARARLGYLATPSVLVYGTGGLAWTRFVDGQDTSTAATTGAVTTVTTTSSATPAWELGWVAGLGIETRIAETNWLARLEYLHYDFGDSGSASQVVTTPGGVVTSTSSTTSGHLTTDVVRAALGYKFDWPPVGPRRAVMALKAPLTTAWSWSGFYVGGHGGYGWAQDPFTQPFMFHIPGVATLSGFDSKGFVGGFQTGGNWQSGNFVGGLEFDLSGTDIKGSNSASGVDNFFFIGNTLTVTQTDKFDLLGSARARLGYLPWQGMLLYGTAGLAWTRLDQTVTTVGTTQADITTTTTATPAWKFGWVVGGGGEVRLGDSNWLARLEYLHYDFGNSGYVTPTTFFADGVPTFSTATGFATGRMTTDVVRAGLDYKLN